MPDPPSTTTARLPLTPLTAPLLADAPASGPWANDLFPAVLLLALGAALVALGAWIVKPPPRPPRGGPHAGRGHARKRTRGPRRDRRPPADAAGPANYSSPPSDPLRRPLRLP